MFGFLRLLNHSIQGETFITHQMNDENIEALHRAEFNSPFSIGRNHIKPNKEIKYGKSYCDLPCRNVVQMTTDVLATDTGPEGGIQCLSVKTKERFNNFYGKRPVLDAVAGIPNWNMHHHKAYGLSESLYDFDPMTQAVSGEPNADVFAVVARENNAFLAVADGVNWGEKSFMAARSAVKGCIEYLSVHLHKASTTQEISKVMLRSFKHAQFCIIDNQATLTTLCAAVVCKLQDIDCYGVCVVNVGDSLAYVYRKDGLYVQEITYGSHENETRDMRNAGGCLGPSDGYNPDLANLTCSFTFVEEGDIVFLTTDGISDNFDPVVLKKSRNEVQELINPVQTSICAETDLLIRTDGPVTDITKSLPPVRKPITGSESSNLSIPSSDDDRQSYACALMKQKIESESPSGQESSAKELCANLMSYVVNQTFEKRNILENGDIQPQVHRYQQSKEKPGKLDHATVVAYEIGHFEPEPLKLTSQGKPTSQVESAEFFSMIGMLK